MEDKKFNPAEATLDKFDPTKADLINLVAKVKDLQIKDVDDKEGYVALNTALQDLRKLATETRTTTKNYRADAILFQKAIVAIEKEMLAEIEPTIKVLAERRKVVDDIKEAAKRDKLLPERKEKLAELGVELTDEQITSMDDNEFDEYFLAKKEAILEAKETEIKEREDKAIKEMHDREVAEDAEKKAREDAIEQAKLDKLKTDAAKEKAVADAIQAEKDKAAKLKLDQEENDRIKKQAEADLVKKEKEEEAEVERQKALSPDKEKLLTWALAIERLKAPDLQKEHQTLALSYKLKLEELATNLKAEINKL